jgi:chromate transporter
VVAVAIVAQAVWGMARSLCPDRPRAALAILAALLTMILPSAAGQLAAIAVAGLLGWWRLKIAQPGGGQAHSYPVSRKLGIVALLLFAAPLVGLPLWAAATGSSTIALLEGVYRSGALVFGGGHVVLPLLQAAVVPSGIVSNADFLAGYGAAQAVPGPLFTFSAYLGAVATGRCMAGSVVWHCWAPSSCRPSSCWSARCRSGKGCATARASRRPWRASTPAWSAFWCRPCTTRCGRAPSTARRISGWRCFVRAADGGSPPALVVLLAGLAGWVMAMGI